MKLDTSMDEYCWAVYRGNERVMGPYEVTGDPKDLFGVMRNAMKQAGYHEPEAPPLATTQTGKTSEPAKVKAAPKKETSVAKAEPEAEVLPPLPTLHMTDDETGEIVEITLPMRRAAQEVHGDILLHDQAAGLHLFQLGMALQRMRGERLYLAMGLRSFSAYCEHVQLSRQVAYDRIAAFETNRTLLLTDGVVAPVRQLSYTNTLLMARSHPDDVRTVATQNDVSQMSKRQLDEALSDAKRERERREEAERRSAKLEEEKVTLVEENKRLKSTAPPPPQVVDNPELLKRLKDAEEATQRAQQVAAEAERQRKQAEDENAKLLAQHNGEVEARRKKEQAEKQAELAEQRSRRLTREWQENGLDPNGGPQLMEVTEPLLGPVAKALAKARELKHSGAGGPLSEETVHQLIGDLRDLTDLLSKIMQTRKQKTDLVINSKEG